MKKRESVRRSRSRPAGLALCVAAFLFAGGAARGAVVTPLGLVPAGGVVVLRVDWGAVRTDPRLRETIKGDDLETMFRRIGLRSVEVAEAVIFADLAGGNRPDTAMILKGRAPLRPAVATLRDAGWSEGPFRGYRIFGERAGDSCLAGLRSGLLVVGTRGGVERVIGVETGAGRSQMTDANFRRLMAQTARAGYPVSLVTALPQEYQDAADVALKAATGLLSFTGLGPLGSLLDEVGLARGVGFSFTRRGDALPLNLVAVMKDDGAASLVSGTLTLLKGAASLVPARSDEPPDARRARQMFEGMSVVRTREVVSVRLTLPKFEPRR